MKPSLLLLALLAASLLPVPAYAHGDAKHAAVVPAAAEQTPWGIAGKPAEAVRIINIVMSDNMRFTPDAILVKEGETVRFVVMNRGRMRHEMVIGPPAELARHADMMARFPDMAHDEPYMVHVGPGKTGEILWTFNRAGSYEFACLIAGHYAAGMRGTITVTVNQGAAK